MKFSFVGEQHKLSTGQTGISTDVIFSLGSIFADCNREGAKTAHAPTSHRKNADFGTIEGK
jgi:hypothetical protein